MSVAPAPVTYTATNNLNMMKNIFIPQYNFSGGFFHAYVNTYLPGNVAIGDPTTNFSNTLNGLQVTTISDLQNWAQWKATYNLSMNSYSITQVSNLAFGGNSTGQYTINANGGSINISSYFLNGRYTDLSGGIPSWATRPASTTVNMNANNITQLCNVNFASGVSISSSTNIIAFTTGGGRETMRIDGSGKVSIGTTLTNPAWAVTISSGLAVLSNIYVTCSQNTGLFNTTSNSFSVNVQSGSVDIGASALTDLYLNAGGQRQVQIPSAGGLNLLGANGSITSVLKLSNAAGSSSYPGGLTTTNRSTTFIVTSGATATITLPATPVTDNLPKGTYWAIKNATGGGLTLTVTNGTIPNLGGSSPYTLSSNAFITIVYSGGTTVYYGL